MNNAHSFWREANSYRSSRSATWQGEQARSGPRYAPPSIPEGDSNKAPIATSSPSQPSSVWTALEAAAGADDKARVAVSLMKKHMLQSVEALSMDEIELMAKQ